MTKFENIFDQFFDSINNKPDSSFIQKSVAMETMDSAYMVDSLDSFPIGPQDEFLLQEKIRPYFGKTGINDYPIGSPPDFISLEGTGMTQNHYTCTLFVDIKGSTRLSVLYPLDFVFKFKNAVIQTCIEIIRSFDGYVHRIMGDAVMAFFGGSSIEKEDAIAGAINCSITLRAILEESIKPWMERQGLDVKDFGFRVGCDFGDDDEVLWGGFGYQNVGEVSATGLPVDMASKLQGLANKNQTMLGEGLLYFINWPDKYSRVKTRDENGVQKSLEVVTPNLTDNEGKPINYTMRQLEYTKSLQFSALPRDLREKITAGAVKDNLQLQYKCFTVVNGERVEYISASKFLDRNISLIFIVEARTSNRLAFPLKVVFKKTNHGKDTPKCERGIEQEGIVKYIRKNFLNKYTRSVAPLSKVELSEATSYRGLHTMKCEVYDDNGTLLFCDWIGVMIK